MRQPLYVEKRVGSEGLYVEKEKHRAYPWIIHQTDSQRGKVCEFQEKDH